MDPAAIKELQRLYAKKQARPSDRPSKKRKLGTSINQDKAESESEGGSSIESFRNVEDEQAKAGDNDDEDDEDDELESFADFGSTEGEHDAIILPSTTTTVDAPVEVVTFDSKLVNPKDGVAVQGYKSYMSGKTPKQSTAQGSNGGQKIDEAEADDLRKDKELQKLLRDSNLLREQGEYALEATGKTRLKAIEAQRISFGAPKPKQRKMPIGMRKGIEAAAAKRVTAAETHARENNIITAHKAAPIKKKKLNKTLHELNLGTYKNGKLSITRREIDRINGPRGGSAKGKKKRGFRDFSNIG